MIECLIDLLVTDRTTERRPLRCRRSCRKAAQPGTSRHAAVGAVIYGQEGFEVSIYRQTVRLPSVDAVRGALPRRHVARKELIPNYNETRNTAVNTVRIHV